MTAPIILYVSDKLRPRITDRLKFGKTHRIDKTSGLQLPFVNSEELSLLSHPKIELARTNLEAALQRECGETRPIKIFHIKDPWLASTPYGCSIPGTKDIRIGVNDAALILLNTDEVECLLAHEIVHSLVKHGENRSKYEYGLRAARILTFMPDLLAGALVSAGLKFTGQTIFCHGLFNSEEFQADHDGILLTRKPDAFASMLQKIVRTEHEKFCAEHLNGGNTPERRIRRREEIADGTVKRRHEIGLWIGQFLGDHPHHSRRLKRIMITKRQMQRAGIPLAAPVPGG